MELQQTEVKNGKEGLHINVAQMCVTAVLMALTCVATVLITFLPCSSVTLSKT